MADNIVISVVEVVGSALCVAADDGQKVFERVELTLKEGRNATLSFRNVTGLTSAFLNAAIGQLYGVFNEQDIQAHLQVCDMQPEDLALLKRVVETAKTYFRDPERFKRVIQEVLGESDDEG